MAATLRLPAGVLAQFDVALDLTRRDELELVGTEGRLVVPDPWLCRATHLELSRNGRVEHVPVDPDGAFGLTDPDHDVYRIELDTVSAALGGGGEPSFGRSDAIAQATVLEALYRSADLGTGTRASQWRAARVSLLARARRCSASSGGSRISNSAPRMAT